MLQEKEPLYASPSRRSVPESLRFLLIEDHPIFIDGFSGAIHHLFPEVSLTVVTNGHDARRAMSDAHYDLVFLDIDLPDIYGVDLLQEFQQSAHIQPIVTLSGSMSPSIVEKSRMAGAIGAFSKRVDHDRLKDFCDRLLAGDTVFEAEPMRQSILEGQAFGPTERELQVLMELADGLDNAEICRHLNISDSTLRTHLRSLFMKLQVTNRTACVVKATRLGWI